MALPYTVFDPETIKPLLKTILKSRQKDRSDHKNKNQWLVNWDKHWVEHQIRLTVKRWINAGCIASLDQMLFTAYVLDYVDILTRAAIGHNSKPNVTMRTSMSPRASPWAKHNDKYCIGANPSKYLINPVHVVSAALYPDLGLEKCPEDGCTEKIIPRGPCPTGPRTVYGLEYNITVIGFEYQCKTHGTFTTTSPKKLKVVFPDGWQADEIPHFYERSGCTHEFYRFITEFRTSCSIELHLQRMFAQQREWLLQANREKARGTLKTPASYPSHLKRATLSALDAVIPPGGTEEKNMTKWSEEERELELNAVPSEWFIRRLYDNFIMDQRLRESEQYTRTLTGKVLGADSTVKAANKSNLYSMYVDENGKKSMSVTNIWGGGILTIVNEDKELVSWRYLPSNAVLEMKEPLLEYAIRADTLECLFRTHGELCVDRCCDFRRLLNLTLRLIRICQDFMHLKQRIMITIPKKSPLRPLIDQELTLALVEERSDGQGKPTIYRQTEEQLRRYDAVWANYKHIPGLWTQDSERAFTIQRTHIVRGCLQRRHPNIPSHTSGNENWHRRLNNLTRGCASSLTTVVGLLADGILQGNLHIKIYGHSQPSDSMSRQFRAATKGCHHLFLVESTLRETELLTGETQPQFLNIHPEHHFGLVAPQEKYVNS
ncbi:hypothetical protein M422DRAFT_187241 [Sphaerobolus stellatus SS14]|uniref:Uncharacterized protein n=1 Tax=Sphaerobolus stellatus (strain SS14) TaxID=990650 RepID=A0A0C9UYB0_SPHS4|nr:hypothetical protein M422DRAFT_187241 [Sphaerobolus stellatus SS14]